jgi:hypothetical protein
MKFLRIDIANIAVHNDCIGFSQTNENPPLWKTAQKCAAQPHSFLKYLWLDLNIKMQQLYSIHRERPRKNCINALYA